MRGESTLNREHFPDGKKKNRRLRRILGTLDFFSIWGVGGFLLEILNKRSVSGDFKKKTLSSHHHFYFPKTYFRELSADVFFLTRGNELMIYYI